MKIIQVDNFDREAISDELIAENVPYFWGVRITNWLNETFSGETSPDYFRLVPDNYVLYKWSP